MSPRTALAEAPAPIGHNEPPEPNPFDAHKANIDDLYMEAKNWLDGDELINQDQADTVGSLKRKIEEAEKAADASRKRENEPFDTGKAAVQAKYAPLISNTQTIKGKAVLAVEACDSVLTKWLLKVKKEQDAEAERLHLIEEQATQAARDAVKAAADSHDLGVKEQAEELVQVAKQAGRAATQAEVAKPRAHGYGRAVTLKDNWVVKGFEPVADGDKTIDGETALLRYYWTANRDMLIAAALEQARKDARAGNHRIPGLTIKNEPTT